MPSFRRCPYKYVTRNGRVFTLTLVNVVIKEFYLLLFIRDSEAEGGVTFSAGNLAISRSQR